MHLFDALSPFSEFQILNPVSGSAFGTSLSDNTLDRILQLPVIVRYLCNYLVLLCHPFMQYMDQNTFGLQWNFLCGQNLCKNRMSFLYDVFVCGFPDLRDNTIMNSRGALLLLTVLCSSLSLRLQAVFVKVNFSVFFLQLRSFSNVLGIFQFI